MHGDRRMDTAPCGRCRARHGWGGANHAAHVTWGIESACLGDQLLLELPFFLLQTKACMPLAGRVGLLCHVDLAIVARKGSRQDKQGQMLA